MQATKRRRIRKTLPALMAVLLFAGLCGLLWPAAALAAGGDITISGPGLNNSGPITVTQNQLRGTEALPPDLQVVYGAVYLEQHDEWYSTINTWPTKSWYRGEGVKLTDLLKLAGGLKPGATLIRFTSSDGFSATFTVQELLNEPRYRFPNFIDYSLPAPDRYFGHIPGDPSGAVRVEAIIAHRSFSTQSIEDIGDDEKFSDADANHLLYGQRAVTEQTGPLFAKYINNIEVLTDSPGKWDDPKATRGSGTVSPGTLVELSSNNMDIDKIYYTTDGSTPDINSPMYNWIARRWWSARGEERVTEINRPIRITKDTTIKAVTIGPGKRNSDVVTFTYKVTTDTPGHWAENNIKELVALGAIGGYPDGTFRPDNRISRAEFATILVKAFELDPQSGKVFADTAGHWAKETIATAASYGIVSGYDAATFGPDDPVTREQMAVMVMGAAKLEPVAGELPFKDGGKVSGWAKEAVAAAVGSGIIGGYPDNTLRPQGNATRAEAVTVIVNAMRKAVVQ